jgi:hypothetical protein
VRKGSRDLLGAQAHIAATCPHRHADGQRGQVGAEPVTRDRIQHGQRQVTCRFASGRLAVGAKDRPGLAAHRPRRQPGTPHREVSAPRHEVMDKPDRCARRPDRGKARPAMTWCTCSMRDTSPANAWPLSLPTAQSSAGVTVCLPSAGAARPLPQLQPMRKPPSTPIRVHGDVVRAVDALIVVAGGSAEVADAVAAGAPST